MSVLVGKLVRVRGLTGRADLNGRVGTAITLIEETGRLAVQVGDTKDAFKIKPANLDDITEASAEFGRRQAALRSRIEAQQQWVAGKHQVVDAAPLDELRELVAEAEACSAVRLP